MLNMFVTTLLFNLFALVTILLRPKLFNTELYSPMIWNFKLSVLPFLALTLNMATFIFLRYIGVFFSIHWLLSLSNVLVILGFIAWLLLLPNSGYLVTELNLNHRDKDGDIVPMWYDIISILSFALSGILNLLVNILMIQLFYLIYFDPKTISLSDHVYLTAIAIGLFILVSIGIFVGREIRLNSWDIVHPIQMIKKLFNHFKQKGAFINFLRFIFFHTLFFLILYFAFNIQRLIK